MNNQFLAQIKKNAGLTILLGVLIVLVGLMALSSPLITGLSVAFMVGILLIIGGAFQLLFAFKTGKGIWPYIIGVLSVIAGGYMVGNPMVASATLTIFLAAYLLVSGVSEMIMAFQIKPMSGWGWLLFGGVLSVLLGMMIWGQYPLSGAVAIGIFLGFKLLFDGLTLIMLGMSARSLAKQIGS